MITLVIAMIIYRGWRKNLTVPLSVYLIGFNSDLTMPLLILPINYKLFSYFIAIPFFRWDFCFTQGISRCRIFCHSAISTSIIPSIGSMCGPRFLSKFSGSFRHKSLIKMIKYSLFEWIKSFFKFSTICLSNLFGYFCKVAYPKIW